MDHTDPNKLVLQSSFDQIDRLEPFLKKTQQQAGFDDELFARIQLALNEAVTNAIIHGNNENASKSVYISSSFNEKILEISVQDEGPGFDHAALPDPLEDENLLKESGRGVFLIKQYSDDVSFSNGGRTLTMRFSL